MYFEATANLTGDMLVKVDRMSMANSLEVRSPLLDHQLAEFAASLPYSWKMREGAANASSSMLSATVCRPNFSIAAKWVSGCRSRMVSGPAPAHAVGPSDLYAISGSRRGIA